ncbi:MAG: YceI family protein [Planctomycetes bacterium]|nr:YceI family protein [Planctomycetota bacterium]
MRNRLLIAATGATLALLAWGVARTPAQAPSAVDHVLPGTVDVERSRVFIKVPARKFGHEHGIEGRLQAGLISLGAPQQAGELVFDLTSFQADTNLARTYLAIPKDMPPDDQKKVTDTMHGDEVLDVAKYRVANFRLRSASESPNRRASDPPMYTLDGDLTLHGKTQRVTLTVIGEQVKDQMRLRGTFNLKQSDYGITPYTKLLGAIGVQDELKVHGEIWVKAVEK